MKLINDSLMNIDEELLSQIDNLEYSLLPNVVGIATEIKEGKLIYIAYMTNENGNIILRGESNNFFVALSHAKGMYRGLNIKEQISDIKVESKVKKKTLFKNGKK